VNEGHYFISILKCNDCFANARVLCCSWYLWGLLMIFLLLNVHGKIPLNLMTIINNSKLLTNNYDKTIMQCLLTFDLFNDFP
jgi:hypothetical protein